VKTKILKIGFQGEKGAYSEKAIAALYNEQQVENVAFRTSYAVIDALKKKKIDFGLLPIENSIMGSITHTYDLLLENRLHIVQEVIIPIHHALLALTGVKQKELKTIYSHPAAIAQCEVFLRKFEKAEILPTYDTAGSARMPPAVKGFGYLVHVHVAVRTQTNFMCARFYLTNKQAHFASANGYSIISQLFNFILFTFG